MNEKDIVGSISENIKSNNEDVRGDNFWMLQQLADQSLSITCYAQFSI